LSLGRYQSVKSTSFSFELQHVDKHTGARAGLLRTPHGEIPTPVFMPVGTIGSVKGLTPEQIQSTRASIVLCNTYHLALRPGENIVEELGGLHQFMDWDGPILTDSGGFQVFSLSNMNQVTESGVVFRSHIDGSKIEITPERSIEIQQKLGSDIAMAFDHVVELPNTFSEIKQACDRSTRWAERCRQVANHPYVLRQNSARELVSMDFPGYAIGGLSVGETPEEMYQTLEISCPELPVEKPRYLMGVGRPEDLLESVGRGIDLFDCVMPTRNGRNALAFTDSGPIRFRNKRHEKDPNPIQKGFESAVSRFSRGYIRHLFQAKEMLGPIILSIHNLTYYQKLMQEARQSILADCYGDFLAKKHRNWQSSSLSP
jgi:queuine tRNA-ribosyltransferase